MVTKQTPVDLTSLHGTGRKESFQQQHQIIPKLLLNLMPKPVKG